MHCVISQTYPFFKTDFLLGIRPTPNQQNYCLVNLVTFSLFKVKKKLKKKTREKVK